MQDGFSSVSKTNISRKLNVPYISRYVPEAADKQFLWGMSQTCYRELLRHVFARHDSLYLYNLGYEPRWAIRKR